MGVKSAYLQIRVSPRQKALLKRAAESAGQDLSAYVLARALPPAQIRFAELIAMLREDADHRYVLAELNDFLSALGRAELREAVGQADLASLSAFLKNYVAAMVEQVSYIRSVPAPAWTSQVAPLDMPRFSISGKGLRPHLLRASPVPFKRRNIFVDASIGARV